MNYEFNSYINGAVVKIFLINPLMDEHSMTKIIHSHKYTEFHMVTGGCLTALVENKKYVFYPGDIYAVPGGVYHCYTDAEAQTRVVAFQADIPFAAFGQRAGSESLIKEIVGILEKGRFHADCSGLSALFSFAASAFYAPEPTKQSKDNAILIYEFISNNYNRDSNISELSKILCLSDKQTERLVKLYTGYTFKKTIMNYRMEVANFLEQNTDLSKSEISRYVGYSNYSGFWKAKKLFCGTE